MEEEKSIKDDLYDKLMSEFNKYEIDLKNLKKVPEKDILPSLSVMWGCKQIIKNVFQKY
jgi:hypothetical protein